MVGNSKRNAILLILALSLCSSFVFSADFYQSNKIFQNFFSLLILDILVLMFLVEYKRLDIVKLPISSFAIIVSVFIFYCTTGYNLLLASVLLIYAAIIVMLSLTGMARYGPLFVAYSACLMCVFCCYEMMLQNMSVAQYGSARIDGLYGQPNLLAALLLLGIFCYSHLLWVSCQDGFLKYFPLFIMAFFLLGTGSRAAVVSLGVVAMYSLIWWKDKKYPNFIRVLSPLIVIFLVAGLSSELLLDWTPVSRVGESFDSGNVSGSTYKRLVYWLSALMIWRDNWLFGAGYGGFRQNLGEYAVRACEHLQLTYDLIGQTLWAHNDFLHVLSDHGVYFFLFLVVLMLRLITISFRYVSLKRYFLFLALLSFSVMMMFGHPLYWPNLALMICFILPSFRSISVLPVFHVGLRTFSVVLVFIVFGVNIVFMQHMFDSYHMHNLSTKISAGGENIYEKIHDIDKSQLRHLFSNSVLGWKYQHSFYTYLVSQAIEQQSTDALQWAREDMLVFAKENSFPSYLHSLASLLFYLEEYEGAKEYAQMAFERKPDVDEYFALYHLANAMLISQRQKLPISRLISEKNLAVLYGNETLRVDMFNSDGAVRRGN